MYAVIMTDSYVNLSKMHVARGFVKNYLGRPIAGAPHALLEARHLTENSEGLPYSWPDALELDTRISEVYYDNVGLRSCDFVVPTCEVRNRVYQVAHVSLCIDSTATEAHPSTGVEGRVCACLPIRGRLWAEVGDEEEGRVEDEACEAEDDEEFGSFEASLGCSDTAVSSVDFNMDARGAKNSE